VIPRSKSIDFGESKDKSVTMMKLFGVVVIVLFVLSRDGVNAVTCYDCASEDSSCKDPFSSSGVAKCTGATCVKISASAYGVSAVARTCSTSTDDQCTSDSFGGAKETTCYCNTDLCNSGWTRRAGQTGYLLTALITTILAALRLA